ncbi:GNAT family N-acetyltransferase [Streptomyces sp. NBC_01619]|uniref:GNAT family N-acetyltransferase n=1 Tax=Streptomyces sp. NBC_01619 TaxID=2975901 RepID=UPI00225097BE|nr:GNAT family N-acetyltransferase [Streptomyces sp. NBC_01619]MCX4515912.1 GNAT family N-acetyltransferase [Streptomyces sp. NBC_01619]
MSIPLLRLATSDDALDVFGLLTQVPAWQEKNQQRWLDDLQEQEECGDGARRGVWVLEVGGAVRGTAVVHRRSPETTGGRTWPVYLAYLIIDREHRRHGYGALLEEQVMRELSRQDCSGAYLRVHEDDPGWEGALEFWARQGWKQAASSRPRHILMTRSLSAPHSEPS